MKNDKILRKNLRWLLIACIVLPILFFAILELARNLYLSQIMTRWHERLFVLAILSIGAVVFSNLIFSIIRKLQSNNNEQRRQLRAINDIGLKLASEHQLDDILETVLRSASEMLSVKYGMLAVLGENQTIRSVVCIKEQHCQNLEQSSLILNSVLSNICINGRLLLTNDLQRQSQFKDISDLCPNAKRLLGVPIISQSKVIGGVYLCDKSSDKIFTSENSSQLSLLAAQAAVAIENAHIYERLSQLAILEERQRIAMELHDGAIQSLYATGLHLESMSERSKNTENGYIQVSGAKDKIDSIVNDINLVIKELRNYIANLNHDMINKQTFTQAIKRETIRLRAHGIKQIQVDIDKEFTTKQDNSLYRIERILHECITNIIKHSQASDVLLRVESNDSRSTVVIRDNGVGADLSKNAGEEHLGIANIRKRLKSVDGLIKIETQPGNGYTVYLTIPNLSSRKN